MRSGSIVIIIMLLISGCNSSSRKTITPGFYYWQSNYELSKAEETALSSTGAKKIYIKFFDISWDKAAAQPVPASGISFSEIPEGLHIVPVIFITNETLQQLGEPELQTLAFKMSRKLEGILLENNIKAPQEIQLDCDWTESTRDKYFSLITQLKNYPAWAEIKWSATIRLHQVKYPETTGIPPVDRGMLMFYNMGDIEDAAANNSIYDKNIANAYTASIDDYPLQLDVAIACFSWGLLFENAKLLKIYYPLYATDMPDSLFQNTGASRYTAMQNFYFKGAFIDSGNVIKLESMTPELSLESAKELAAHIRNDSVSVILYHLDPTIINTYTNEDLKNIFSAFQ